MNHTPMKLSDLTSKTKQLAIDVEGDVLHLEVRLHAVTLKALAELDQLGTAAQENALANAQATVAMFCRIVASWDVVDAQGKPLPLDAAHLAEFPVDVLGTLMGKITQALQAGTPVGGTAGEAPAPETNSAPSGAIS